MLVGTVALPVTAADCPADGYDGRENVLEPAEDASRSHSTSLPPSGCAKLRPCSRIRMITPLGSLPIAGRRMQLRRLRPTCANCLTLVASSHFRRFLGSVPGLLADSQSSRALDAGHTLSGCAVRASRPTFSASFREWARHWPSVCMRRSTSRHWSSSRLHCTRSMVSRLLESVRGGLQSCVPRSVKCWRASARYAPVLRMSHRSPSCLMSIANTMQR